MASRPPIRDRAREPICPNCGGEVKRRSLRGPAPKFCSNACKVQMQNRLTVEGRALVHFVKAWRIDRGSGEIAQASLAQLCEIADGFNAKDLESGRPRADLYAAKLLSEGTRYIDRRRGPLAPRIAANLQQNESEGK